MRMESKSAIRLARSYGLLRYKVVSSLPDFRQGRGQMLLGASDRLRTRLQKPQIQTWLPSKGAAVLRPYKAISNPRPSRPAASDASSTRRRGRGTAARERGR